MDIKFAKIKVIKKMKDFFLSPPTSYLKMSLSWVSLDQPNDSVEKLKIGVKETSGE